MRHAPLEQRARQMARSIPMPSRDFPLHRGANVPLGAEERAFLEPQFGFNFGDVRVHTDDRAADAAQQRNARAFTSGRDIFFGAGEYTPEVLAHELTHVVQQATVPGLAGAVQCDDKDTPPAKGTPSKTPALTADWVHKAEGHAIARYVVDGIDFRVAVPIPDLATWAAKLPAMAAEIKRGNLSISDPAMKVTLCLVASTTTRYATYKGAPILAIDPADADPDSVRHEMGHAVFAFYESQSKDPKSKLKDVPLVIADIYVRLKATKEVEDTARKTSGAEKQTHPAGLWIVDPSQWSATDHTEHPWDDPDEFFASARKAYLTNPAGLKKAIAKFTKLDSAVATPAADLLTVIEQLDKGKVPKTPKKLASEAETEIKGLSAPTKIEDTMGGTFRKTTRWALDPTTIPGVKTP